MGEESERSLLLCPGNPVLVAAGSAGAGVFAPMGSAENVTNNEKR